MKRATILSETAKRSIGLKKGTSAARYEMKLLLEDYEYKKAQLESIMEEIESLCKKDTRKRATTRVNNPLKKKQSVIAISCKLIRILYAILEKGIIYDPEKMISDIHRPMQKA